MKRFLFGLLIALAFLGLFYGLFLADFKDSSSAIAPNGEPIGAQHPRSGQ